MKLHRLRALALCLALALVASACGGSSDGSAADDDATTSEQGSTDSSNADGDADAEDDGETDGGGEDATADHDPDGVLRVAYFMARLGLEIEPEANNVWGNPTTHHAVLTQIMGTPLIVDRDGAYVPFLAESYEIVDASTVTLTLREGLTFHDGTPYTAQILADFMLEMQGLETNAFASFALSEVASIDVASDTEMTFNLSSPVAGLFPETLASVSAMPASPASNPPETLYGAGPFMVTDFARDDHLTVAKYDDFFDADAYLLGGIEFVGIEDIEAAQNALEAGQVDLIATNPRDVDALLQRGPFGSVVTQNQGHYMLAVCSVAPPFDDPVFREAVDLAINRDQINEFVLGNNAESLAGVWNPGAPFAAEGLIDADGDQDRARELLAEIGWDAETEVVLAHYPGFQTHQLIAEAVQGQLAQVGITTNLTVFEGYDVASFLNPDTGGFHVVANVNPGIKAITIPGGGAALPWNPCGFSDPELQTMADAISAGDLGDAELADAWAEIQTYVADNHLWYPLVSQPAVYVYNAERVQGVQPGTIGLTGATAPSLYFDGVSIAAE